MGVSDLIRTSQEQKMLMFNIYHKEVKGMRIELLMECC